MAEHITEADCRILSKYRNAGQGAWTTMPEEDKAAYGRINNTLGQILHRVLSASQHRAVLDSCLTLGFSPRGGVRGNRPKDLWCAVFAKNAVVYMPQVYLIASLRGIELGFAAGIHPRDFSNATFKSKVKEVVPMIFDLLPQPDDTESQRFEEALRMSGEWHYRRSTRMEPGPGEFSDWSQLLAFLKSPEGKVQGGGAICRYWTPEDLYRVDFVEEFAEALELFTPLVLVGKSVAPAIVQAAPVDDSFQTSELPAPSAEPVSRGIEQFLELYPETRSAQAFGVNQELWGVLDEIKQSLLAMPALQSRPQIKVAWSVGQGNWARVPWIAFLDTRTTTTTQRGIYAVILFREDMSGAYLTFNQGVTQSKKDRGATAGLQLLRETAQGLRQGCLQLGAQGFSLDDGIDLRTDASLGRDYEVSTIAYKLYERGAVPDDGAIAADLEILLAVYMRYVEGQAKRLQMAHNDLAPPLTRPLTEAPPYTFDDIQRDLFLDDQMLEEMREVWRAKKNLVLQGPPGVGKTFIARRLAWLLMGHRDNARLRMVQFHQAYAYEDFVQGYRPVDGGGFQRQDGQFYDFCKLAEADAERDYVFIVDEINRGNLAKIMGELMMLIEGDKRGVENALRLSYGRPDELPFSVPTNLYLLGLMNTADRSLAMVDYALRRRFAFFGLEPRFASPKFRQHLESRGASPETVTQLVERMLALNADIAADTTNLGPGYCVGHSFFVPSNGTKCDAAWYQRVIQHEVAPLLREYWFDNPKRADEWADRLKEPI